MLLVTKIGWLSTRPVAGGYESSIKLNGTDTYVVLRKHETFDAAVAYHGRAWSQTDHIEADLTATATH